LFWGDGVPINDKFQAKNFGSENKRTGIEEARITVGATIYYVINK
jgi:hypothetical protein